VKFRADPLGHRDYYTRRLTLNTGRRITIRVLRAAYSSRIETLRTQHGHRTVSGLTRDRIITGILHLSWKPSPKVGNPAG
jgi:hypothetical protein